MNLRRSVLRRALAVSCCWWLTLAAACADHVSPEELAEIVEGARSCGAADSCVLAGAGPCTCATPVRAAAAADVDAAVADVECEGAVARCAGHANVRCEGGRCISDPPP
jgi:hypothetical protein